MSDHCPHSQYGHCPSCVRELHHLLNAARGMHTRPDLCTTTHEVEVTTPGGEDTNIIIAVDWEYDANPCDKEPAHYRGEDDGWSPVNVDLT